MSRGNAKHTPTPSIQPDTDFYPQALETCRACPRLAEHREAVAAKITMRRKAYADESYWGKPVPGFGDPQASILLLGLAPGAHGSNRTGRMFTGDASGDFLYPALYRSGLASQPQSTHRGDGMKLKHLWITAAARCVPPGNKLKRDELMNCQTWLSYDMARLPKLKLVLALGRVAHDAYLEYVKGSGIKIVKRAYPFKHGVRHDVDTALPVLNSYHVSYQNTNTGKLSVAMFAAILEEAKHLAGIPV